MKVVTARIPDRYVKDLEQIEKEEHVDRAEVIRKLLDRGISEWRRNKALRLLGEHKLSIRKAAVLAGVSYVEMLDLAAERGIDSGYSLEDLRVDLERN